RPSLPLRLRSANLGSYHPYPIPKLCDKRSLLRSAFLKHAGDFLPLKPEPDCEDKQRSDHERIEVTHRTAFRGAEIPSEQSWRRHWLRYWWQRPAVSIPNLFLCFH